MKKFSLLVPFMVLLITITSCKKEDSPSFVDDYNAPLTEEKGTEHNGDYFPLEEGYSWYYSGEEQAIGEMKISFPGENETEKINETMSIYSSVLVEPIESVTLESGNYMLYPVSDYYSTSYSYRYFEKKTDGVYFKAFKSETGDVVEVKKPMFIKKPLIVGESWETQPSIDLNSMLTDSDLNFSEDEMEASISCKMYVIGLENITWKSEEVSPLRLDQRAEATVNMAFNEEGVSVKMNMNLKITSILYLLEDIGVIEQDIDMDMITNISMSAEGQSGSINMNVNVKGDLTLDTYDLSGSSVKNSVTITDKNGVELNIAENETYKKAVEKSLRVAKYIKGLSTF
jgi:hypothetical protein